MATLLKGSSADIIQQNHQALQSEGMSEAQAMHLALKHANKHKASGRATKGVVKKVRENV